MRRASIVLPLPGGPIHQDVVPAGRRDLEGALGGRLPFHLGEVDVVARPLREQRGQVDTGLRQLRLTVEEIGELGEIARAEHPHA
jgi:hypothetical protein